MIPYAELVYQKPLRPYTAAVRRASVGGRTLSQSHELRIECALNHLPLQPLREYGLDRMVAEARANVSVTVGPDVLEWLPAAENHFCGL